MDKVILTDWDISHNAKSHYSLYGEHKTKLENLFSKKIVSFDQLTNNQRVLFYWGNKFKMSLLHQFPNLCWIHLGSSGFDNLDLAELSKRKITLTTSRGLFSSLVAEYLLSVVLFSSKFALEMVFDKNNNNRLFLEHNNKLPMTLSDLRILVFGTGKISIAFKELMLKLGVNIECVSVSERPGFKSWGDIVSANTYSHVISLVALNGSTHSFFNKEIFYTICSGSIFINAGRGQTVDQSSLIAAINDNVLKGAILDTHLEFNGDCSNLPYYNHPKILCSPHIASWSNRFSVVQFEFLKERLDINND